MMNMRKGIAVAGVGLLLALGASSCSSGAGTVSNTSEVVPGAAISVKSLAGEWQLQSGSMEGQVFEVEAPVVITVSEDSSFRIDADCNSIGGNFVLNSDGTLSSKELHTTQMGCEDARGRMEDKAIAVMGALTGATLTEGGELTFLGEEGTLVLTK